MKYLGAGVVSIFSDSFEYHGKKKQENRPDNQRDVSKARILVNAQEGNDKRVEGRHFLDSNFSRKGMW